MKNIIIFGDDETGKSTLAKSVSMISTSPRYLSTRVNQVILPISLASSLRIELSRSNAELDFDSKPTSKESREKMIDTATKRKKINPRYYCNEVLKVMEVLPSNILVAIDDGRFQVEFDFFKKLGFLSVGLISEKLKNNIYSEEANQMALNSDLIFGSKIARPFDMAVEILKHL